MSYMKGELSEKHARRPRGTIEECLISRVGSKMAICIARSFDCLIV